MPGGRGADKAGSGARSASRGSSSSSKGSDSKGSKGSSGGKDNGGRRGGRTSMGDLNDKFGGRDYGKTTNDKDKGSEGKTTGSRQVTNEVRRNPKTGKFENVHTDYSKPAGTPGRTKSGQVQHGRITDRGGTREYTGKAGDTKFGRDVSIAGATTSAAIAEKFMEASQWNHMADDAFQSGDYASWAKFKSKYATTQLGANIQNQINDFTQAPMDYAANLLKNPLIGGAAVMSGAGLTAFGVTAVDAVMDMVQNEASVPDALKSIASGAIGFTPVGAALGPMKGIAKAALESPEKAAVAMGGLIGGKIGTNVAPQLASALTDNPMVGAGIAAAGVTAAGYAGRKAMETALSSGAPQGPVGMESPEAPQGDRKDAVSPLVSSGKEAVKASQQLAKASRQPVDLYARTVRQLPFYGLDLPNNNLPMYGV